MKKNCTNCELYINNTCCGRNDYYGKDTKEIFKNGCEEYEESFESIQSNCKNKEELIEKLVEKMAGNK